MPAYIPQRGDLVWLNFTPQSGHEQVGKRPAFVVSPQSYNKKTGLALFCPVTSQVKGYPFEVAIPAGGEVRGVVLSDQVKSLDWAARQATFITRSSSQTTEEVLAKVAVLIE